MSRRRQLLAGSTLSSDAARHGGLYAQALLTTQRILVSTDLRFIARRCPIQSGNLISYRALGLLPALDMLSAFRFLSCPFLETMCLGAEMLARFAVQLGSTSEVALGKSFGPLLK